MFSGSLLMHVNALFICITMQYAHTDILSKTTKHEYFYGGYFAPIPVDYSLCTIIWLVVVILYTSLLLQCPN